MFYAFSIAFSGYSLARRKILRRLLIE